MPVDLSIVESTTELGQTVVEVVLDSSSAPGVAGPGVPVAGTTGQVLKKASNTDYDTEWEDASAPGAHASTHQDGGADEISLTGLSGTPAALTTHESDTTAVHGIADTSALALTANHPSNATFNDHSARHENGGADEVSVDGLSGLLADGQTPLAHNHAGEEITSGTVADARIAATIARDSEVTTAVSDHSADTTAVHGIADTSAVALTANHPTNATFNDHSARHEDGGADEISIAGLAGTPTDLQTHLDDGTAAHAGSAVSVDSTTLSGSGTTVQASLEEIDNLLDDHSSRHENGGADAISIAGLAGTSTELTNHLNDATDAHDASAISIADAASLYTGINVETAMQELGVWTTYTPTLTGSGGNPTLGASNERYGDYCQIGHTIIGNVRVQVGGAGYSNGTGDVICSLPVAMAATMAAQLRVVGGGHFQDASGADIYVCTVFSNTTTTVKFRWHSTTAITLVYTTPVTWAANDEIVFHFAYRIV